MKTQSGRGIVLTLTGLLKTSVYKSAARVSLSKLFQKAAEKFNFTQYKYMEYITKENDEKDICSAMKLEGSACNVTLELFGKSN